MTKESASDKFGSPSKSRSLASKSLVLKAALSFSQSKPKSTNASSENLSGRLSGIKAESSDEKPQLGSSILYPTGSSGLYYKDTLHSLLQRRLVFVLGKGGVGKTVISQALATHRASSSEAHFRQNVSKPSQTGRDSPILHLTFEDPVEPSDLLQKIQPRLYHCNASAQTCFEEYIQLKLRLPKVTSLLLKNKLIRYLSHATPGVKEVVLLGKAWAERMNYQQVICDMPATGHGLAMFSSVKNFTELFRESIISSDANEMLATFSNPKKTGFLIVALPEEMPLKESLELSEKLKTLFPQNPPAFLVNKLFPSDSENKDLSEDPVEWDSPLPKNRQDYLHKRILRERWNLQIWKENDIPFFQVPYFLNRLADHTDNQNPVLHANFDALVSAIALFIGSEDFRPHSVSETRASRLSSARFKAESR